jgi:phosphoglycerol transferase MdoB-like AlkP superfamily enzyme
MVMLFLQRIPKLLRWIFSVVLVFIATMTISRFIFLWRYNPPGKAFSGSAFIMGLRFDTKFACMIGLAILILCAFPFLNPFKNFKAKKFWNFFIPLLFIVLLFFYGADYYHYDYLHQRLNASVLNYLEDAGISFNMMWETYPLLRIALLFIVLAVLARWFFGKLLMKYQTENSFNKRKGIGFYIIAVLLLAQCIIGKIVVKPGQFPLRWSDAYTLSDDFKANLALNPFQSFFSSLNFRGTYDIKKVKELYPLMVKQFGVTTFDSVALNYERKITATDTFINKPNVVLVICESFSAYKSSMYGNPLNTTPYFNNMCVNGIFFDRCFTPAYGTARGVWATVTGIPDVESPKTASRNPNAVNQHTIINDFKGYEHFYFLGGDPTWANIQGLLANNISGLHIYDQNNAKADAVDVWGISDKNLFLEANDILKQQTKPFFSIIQTADNHRPYTIPKEDEKEFTKTDFPADSLQKYGFESNNEMNAFRYTDFCYQKFMEAAKKEKYFDNTIFVFVGDHGIPGNSADMFPKSWKEKVLTAEHVPLLFYAPKLLQPKKIHEVCSQLDVLPSVAHLAKISYRNTTFGRNVFDTVASIKDQYKTIISLPHYAFIFDEGAKNIGLVSDEYYFLKNLRSGKEDMVSVINNDAVPSNPVTDNLKAYLSRLTGAYYQTAKYLMLNNKKQ